MPDGLMILLAFILIVIIYTVAKIRRLKKLSEKQWQQVDKSKLKEWQDDDDW